MSDFDLRSYNRQAWNREVERGNPWTVPVSPDVVAQAREGHWTIVLTPTIPVPRAWFPQEMAGSDILCLASGGGQQGPVLGATGANVTVYDNSPAQLARDRAVAQRDGLDITLVEGDMRDLTAFPDHSFDLIVHPVSNIFVPDVQPIWNEAYRVLRPGGALLAGLTNPAVYLFDQEAYERGELEVRFSLPYADVDHLSEEERKRHTDTEEPLEFSHTLEALIGGQLKAGLLLTSFYEDNYDDPQEDPLARHMPMFFATRAIRPSNG